VSAAAAASTPATQSEPVRRSSTPRIQKKTAHTKQATRSTSLITEVAEVRKAGETRRTSPARSGGAPRRAATNAVPSVAATAGTRNAACRPGSEKPTARDAAAIA